jgi:hypothetical protein
MRRTGVRISWPWEIPIGLPMGLPMEFEQGHARPTVSLMVPQKISCAERAYSNLDRVHGLDMCVDGQTATQVRKAVT